MSTAGADERKVAYENRLRKEVERIVTSVVGPGRARVQINADFNVNRITQTSDKYDPASRVVRSSPTREEKSSIGSGNAGAVSVVQPDLSRCGGVTEGMRIAALALIRFAEREQGLMLATGNPKRIRGLADLARKDLQFVNRQRGSGTRLLFDELLAQQGVDATAIGGYRDEEFTHLAVAVSVAAGRADAGFGVHAAAARFGLDFIPLQRERYWFAVRARNVGDAPLERFRAALAGPASQRHARGLARRFRSGRRRWRSPRRPGSEPDRPCRAAPRRSARRARRPGRRSRH